MKPVFVDTSVEFDADPEVAWRVLTDWERQSDWMLEASDIVVVSSQRSGVGVEADATVRVGGIATRDRIRVDVWEPPRHLGIEHLGWVKGRGDLLLSATAPGRTRLDWREELRPPWGGIGGIGLRALSPLLRRTFRRDARVLARLVGEAAAGRYPVNG
jgi:hypothetical protein